MKKVTTLLCGALLSASFSTVAAEAGDSYGLVGVNLWDVSIDSDFGSASVDPRGLEGRYGYFFSRNFAVEGRLGLGISDDLGVEISRNYGVYLRGVLDVNETFQPYALLGYTDMEIEAGDVSDSDNDISFGVGASFGGGNTRFNVEWARLYSDEADGISVDIDSFNLGLLFSF